MGPDRLWTPDRLWGSDKLGGPEILIKRFFMGATAKRVEGL